MNKVMERIMQMDDPERQKKALNIIWEEAQRVGLQKAAKKEQETQQTTTSYQGEIREAGDVMNDRKLMEEKKRQEEIKREEAAKRAERRNNTVGLLKVQEIFKVFKATNKEEQKVLEAKNLLENDNDYIMVSFIYKSDMEKGIQQRCKIERRKLRCYFTQRVFMLNQENCGLTTNEMPHYSRDDDEYSIVANDFQEFSGFGDFGDKREMLFDYTILVNDLKNISCFEIQEMNGYMNLITYPAKSSFVLDKDLQIYLQREGEAV